MADSKLSFYRRKKGLTQEQLSELSGVTTRTIQRIETGVVVPHIQTIKMLAGCLEVDAELLMDEPEGNAANLPKPAPLAALFPLLAFVGLLFPPLNVVLPLAVWIAKHAENPVYDIQGRKALNFQITFTLLLFAAIPLLVFAFWIGLAIVLLVYFYLVVLTLVNLFRVVNRASPNYYWSVSFLRIGAAE